MLMKIAHKNVLCPAHCGVEINYCQSYPVSGITYSFAETVEGLGFAQNDNHHFKAVSVTSRLVVSIH